jgi:hypothetical protein
MGMLLSAYFHWWSEGQGSDFIEKVVSNCEAVVVSHEESLEKALTFSLRVFERIDELQKAMANYRSSVEETGG